MFYIELKKREPNFTRYLLCLTIGENNAQDTITSTRSGTSDYHEDTGGVPENIKSMTLYPPQGRVRVGRAKKEGAKLLGRYMQNNMNKSYARVAINTDMIEELVEILHSELLELVILYDYIDCFFSSEDIIVVI